MSHEKVVLVTRKTRLEGLIERFNSRSQARFYVEHSGGTLRSLSGSMRLIIKRSIPYIEVCNNLPKYSW